MNQATLRDILEALEYLTELVRSDLEADPGETPETPPGAVTDPVIPPAVDDPEPEAPPVVIPDPDPVPEPPVPGYKVSANLEIIDEGERLRFRVTLSENRPCTVRYKQFADTAWKDLPREDSYKYGTGSGHNMRMDKPVIPGFYQFYAYDHVEHSYETDVELFDVVADVVEPEQPEEPVKPPVVVPGAMQLWVSATGSDSNDGTSEGRPLKTAQLAVDRADQGGDSIFIKAGLYNGQRLQSKHTGGESSPITLMGYTREPGDLQPIEGFDHNTTFDPAVFPVFDGGDRSTIGSVFAVRLSHGRNRWSGLQAREFTHGSYIDANVADSRLNLFYCRDIGDINRQQEGAGYRGNGITVNGTRCSMQHVGAVNVTGQGITVSGVDCLIEDGAMFSVEGLEPLDHTYQDGAHPKHNQGTDYPVIFINATRSKMRGMRVGRNGAQGHGGHGMRFQDAVDCVYEDSEVWCQRGGGISAKTNTGCVARGIKIHGRDMDGNAENGAGLGIFMHQGSGGLYCEDIAMDGVYNVIMFASSAPGSVFKDITADDVSSHVFGISGSYEPGILTDTLIENLTVRNAPSVFYYWGMPTAPSVLLVNAQMTGIRQMFQSPAQTVHHGMTSVGGSINLPEGLPNQASAPIPSTPLPPPPTSGNAALRVIDEVEWDGVDSVRIMFGFDTNRNGRLAYRRSDQLAHQYTPADTTGEWGAVGREHHQWIRGLTAGTYTVSAQTAPAGNTAASAWYSVGDAIQVVIPAPDRKTTGEDLTEYTQFLNPGGDDRSTGTISKSTLGYMIKPLSVFWSQYDTSPLSVTTYKGRRCLGVQLDPTPNGGSGTNRFSAGMKIADSTEVWLSQWIATPEGTDFGKVGKVGIGIFAGDAVASGGTPKPNGGSLRIIWRSVTGTGKGQWGLYLYTGGQSPGSYGAEEYNLNDGIPLLITSEWTHHLTRMKLNSNTSKSDGVLQHWIDGQLVKNRSDVLWLASGALKITNLIAGTWYGGNQNLSNYAPEGIQRRYLADWRYKRT